MRELLQNTINTLLSADADLVAGAEYGHASQTRSAQRNGYRHRELDTRVGTIDVAVPELRTGSYEAPRSAEELHCDAEQRHRHAAEAHADNDAPCSRVHQFRDAGEPVDRERRAEQQTEDEQGIHRVAARARRAGELVAHTRPQSGAGAGIGLLVHRSPLDKWQAGYAASHAGFNDLLATGAVATGASPRRRSARGTRSPPSVRSSAGSGRACQMVCVSRTERNGTIMTMTNEKQQHDDGPSGQDLVEQLKASGQLDALFEQIDAAQVELTGDGGSVPAMVEAAQVRGRQAEPTIHQGYEKGAGEASKHANSRNGSTPKTVQAESGPVELEIPRDRAGSFTPRLVPKGQRRLGG